MEIFKDIPGYEGKYQVSNYGNVKSLSRKIKIKSGYRLSNERIMKLSYNKTYIQVQLGKNGRFHTVHRLVALTFIENNDTNKVVNHIDGNKKNNHLSNLEWVTRSENQIHAYKLGLQIPKGVSRETNKFNKKIKAYNENETLIFNSIISCVEHFKTSRTAIQRVVNGLRNHHRNYKFELL